MIPYGQPSLPLTIRIRAGEIVLASTFLVLPRSMHAAQTAVERRERVDGAFCARPFVVAKTAHLTVRSSAEKHAASPPTARCSVRQRGWRRKCQPESRVSASSACGAWGAIAGGGFRITIFDERSPKPRLERVVVAAGRHCDAGEGGATCGAHARASGTGTFHIAWEVGYVVAGGEDLRAVYR